LAASVASSASYESSSDYETASANYSPSYYTYSLASSRLAIASVSPYAT